MWAKSLQSRLTLCNPVNCSPPGSSVHGIFSARILEWVAMPSMGGFFPLRGWTQVSCSSCIASRFFPTEPPGKAMQSQGGSQIYLTATACRCPYYIFLFQTLKYETNLIFSLNTLNKEIGTLSSTHTHTFFFFFHICTFFFTCFSTLFPDFQMVPLLEIFLWLPGILEPASRVKANARSQRNCTQSRGVKNNLGVLS